MYDNFILTEEEILKAKEKIKRFYPYIKKDFDNDDIQRHIYKIENLPSSDITVFLMKAIIVMKQN